MGFLRRVRAIVKSIRSNVALNDTDKLFAVLAHEDESKRDLVYLGNFVKVRKSVV